MKKKYEKPKIIKNPMALWYELKFTEIIYAMCVVAIIVISLLHHVFAAVNVITVSVLGYIFVLLLDYKIEILRYTKFQLNQDLNSQKIYELIQPTLKEKYDM